LQFSEILSKDPPHYRPSPKTDFFANAYFTEKNPLYPLAGSSRNIPLFFQTLKKNDDEFTFYRPFG